MAVIWVPDKCAVCGGKILDGEKVVLISIVNATTYRAKDSTYYHDNETVRVNFIPRGSRKLKHLRCSGYFTNEQLSDEV